ncbi:hypothetical protein [Tautonia plasticadhaerens]|nr:hypothetical protein [Tautonia plasticadhaerens]
MTEEDLKTLLEACRPTPAMYLSGGQPMSSSPQENANRAWAALGEKMGFDYNTVQPISGKGQRFFSAVPSETEEARKERLEREAEEKRQREIARLTEEIAEREKQLAALQAA